MATSNRTPDQPAPRTARNTRRPTWRHRPHLSGATKIRAPHKNPGVDVSVIEDRDAARVIALRGEIDMANADVLYRRLKALAGSAPQRINLDLSQVTFIDCAGLHALDRVAHQVRDSGGSLRLAALSPAADLLFSVADWPNWD